MCMTLDAGLVTSSGGKSVLKPLYYFQLILSLYKGAAPGRITGHIMM